MTWSWIFETLFLLCLFMLCYVYLGYPILAFLLSEYTRKFLDKGTYEPRVTIIISAYNEAKNIGKTLRNKLDLNYRKEKLEIIVVSDGSTDGTDEIVNQFKEKGVKLIRQEPRAGKTAALNRAIPSASGEIIVFSDANSIYANDAVVKLVRNFQNRDVGYVTGKMVYTSLNGSIIGDGCTAYMKYENFLRELETRLGSVVGVDGGIDAVRKELYKPMNPDQLPDFVLPLKIVAQGYRVIYEPEAILMEPTLEASRDEYKMRVRVTLRAFWALWDMRHLLIFMPSPYSGASSSIRPWAPFFLYSWQLWSHKVLRYLAFLFLISSYFCNLVLWPLSLTYKMLFVLQNVFYLGSILLPILEMRGHKPRLLYFNYYFVLLNVASAHAFLKFLLRQKQVTWIPRKG